MSLPVNADRVACYSKTLASTPPLRSFSSINHIMSQPRGEDQRLELAEVKPSRQLVASCHSK